MKNLIVIRYGELHLKGKNRGYFENMLLSNIRRAVSDIPCTLKKIQGRFLLEDYEQFDEERLLSKLKKVFGIHSFSRAIVCETTFETICKTVSDNIDFVGTFKIETNRADKTFPMKSPEISAKVGAFVLDHHPELTVDVRDPEYVISLDLRENGTTFIFTNTYYGTGGLPCGCSGKGMLLLSGGIDSPVAGYMMAKRGMMPEGLHFHSFPYTGELAKQKVETLAGILKDYTGKFVLHVVPFTKIQEAIHVHCPAEMMITIMRRFMMRIAERVSKDRGCGAIITGENLGQVASQTLESMTVTNAVVNIPVFRPVIGMDKNEIIEISKEIGTYETSILPYEDCCTVFLPDNPVIKPKLSTVEAAEQRLDIEGLIEDAISHIERIEL